SPFGERVGVRGIQNYRETLTPNPTPLPTALGGSERWLYYQGFSLLYQLVKRRRPPTLISGLHIGSIRASESNHPHRGVAEWRRRRAVAEAMSALPPKADKQQISRHVRFVPKADICGAAKSTKLSLS